MKQFIQIIVIILTISGILNANTTPTEGTTLQVLAPSGLKLRTEANSSAAVITVMPHGADVTLLEFEDNHNITRVDWVDGKWIKVQYKGNIGWAFDGFLTILNVPSHELEKCYGDLDFLYPVEFWARANFGAVQIDTLTDEYTYLQTHYIFQHDQELTIMEKEASSRLDLYLTDVRVMEVYQLLESMISGRSAKNVFKESSLFIEKDGTIKKVKIDIDGGIEIKEIYDGRVRLTINTYTGC